MPSLKNALSGSVLMLRKGSTATDRSVETAVPWAGVVVVGAIVVVTGLLRAVVDAAVLVAADGSVAGGGALLDPSHPIATTPSTTVASVASLLTGPWIGR